MTDENLAPCAHCGERMLPHLRGAKHPPTPCLWSGLILLESEFDDWNRRAIDETLVQRVIDMARERMVISAENWWYDKTIDEILVELKK